MEIKKEMLRKYEDWRQYFIIEYMRENKEYFDVKGDNEFLIIINYIYKNTYNFYDSKDIELYMQCLENILFDELMSSEAYHLDFEELEWSKIMYNTDKKFWEIKGE